MTKKTSAKGLTKGIVANAVAGVSGAAVAGVEDPGLLLTAGAVGGAKALTKLSAEQLMEFAGVFSDSPATRRLRVAGEAEMYSQLLDDHGPEVEQALSDIPEGQRASELSTVFAATAAGWQRSTGAKKRRVLLAVLVNALQPDTLDAGDAAHILGIVGRLDYGELHFLKHRFSREDQLPEAMDMSHAQAQEKIQMRGRLQRDLGAGTEGGERIARLSAERLVMGAEDQNPFVLRRTWLGNRVLEYCGSDAFREDMPGED